jgi:DNA primase small subunit
MHEDDIKFLELSFKKYYFNNTQKTHVPKDPKQREFGYQKFNHGMVRHLPIKDDKELHLTLITNSPADAYCSNAYYLFPNLPMNEKEWQGADLIFDIDAKDLNLECRNDHTIHKCNDCHNIFQNKSSSCSNCNSTKIDSKSVTCKNCIDGSKNEVKKLKEILVNDFAIPEQNIVTYFSGNEGFHIHIDDSRFKKLGSRERMELVDYIRFNGAIPETFGMTRYKPQRTSFAEFDERGWRGRAAKEIYGNKSKRSKIITQILKSGYTAFQEQLKLAANSIGVKIDPNVTMDIHRIFRLPGSLNSKSGMCKSICKDLDTFDPYSDACVLDDDSIDVLATCPVKFKLNNQKFGPYQNERTSVPTFAAIYMICKGLATTSNKL